MRLIRKLKTVCVCVCVGGGGGGGGASVFLTDFTIALSPDRERYYLSTKVIDA